MLGQEMETDNDVGTEASVQNSITYEEVLLGHEFVGPALPPIEGGWIGGYASVFADHILVVYGLRGYFTRDS